MFAPSRGRKQKLVFAVGTRPMPEVRITDIFALDHTLLGKCMESLQRQVIRTTDAISNLSRCRRPRHGRDRAEKIVGRKAAVGAWFRVRWIGHSSVRCTRSIGLTLPETRDCRGLPKVKSALKHTID